MPGFTAYSGLRVIGQPKPGETVVVAAASGPVGSLVGQLARKAAARAVGIAGDSRREEVDGAGVDVDSIFEQARELGFPVQDEKLKAILKSLRE